MLSIQNLSYRIGSRTLLDNVSVNIPDGQRIGLIGPNGAGKTTLFKLISGEIAADGGGVSLVKNATLGLVRQDFEDEKSPILDVVLAADKERTSLLQEAETVEDPDRMGYIYERLNEIGAYEAPSRAASILAGLGFDDEAQKLNITCFSGGWRARVALACVLFCEPSLLLLDEPTNHLDFESIVWLESFLMRYRKTMIIISHDRNILNKTVDHILHLENKKLVSYTGNYDQFERTRAEKLMNQQALHEKQMAQKEHMMEFVARFRAKASKARQAQSRLKMIEKMDIVDAVMADRVTNFTFPEPKEIKSPLIRLEKVDAGYTTGKPILRNLTLSINTTDRIALLGANGNGKSTLIKLLSDRLDPMLGEIHKSGKMKVGYFAQFQTDELDTTQSPYSLMQAAMIEQPEARVRSLLARFGFDRNKADTKTGELSGGEKARLLFCLMSHDAPHILLLDEPTNHLDMEAREGLIRALNEYTGAVICVSHDPHLIECIADQLWLVADGKCTSFDGDLEDYRKFVMKQRKGERKSSTGAQTSSANAEKEPKSAASKIHAEKEAERLEQLLADIAERKQHIESETAQCWATDAEPKKLKRLDKALNDLSKEQEAAEKALEDVIANL